MFRFSLKRSVLAGIVAVSICASLSFARIKPGGDGHGCAAGCRNLGVGQVWTECMGGRLIKYTCREAGCLICNDADCNYWREGTFTILTTDWLCE